MVFQPRDGDRQATERSMFGRIAAAAALIALAGCAGMESAGRNASRSPEPTRVTSAPPAETAPAPTASAPVASPPPVSEAALPPPSTASSAPPVSAAQPALPPPQADQPVTARDDDDVVVPGQRERQVRPPNGDPRSNAERMEDIRAWDQCVIRVQAAYDRDPMRPQLDTPEDYCRESLGMADRDSIPASRLERRR